ncbi:MAG: thioredoxin [Lachnospiraceae bacterium]|nr:thioredoxin [Lachnospiraceae bacterium]
MAVIEVTEANFEQEVLKSEKPVLVDFWADWCGPCKMLSPIVDQVSDEQSDVKVCKINVDENLNIARKYNVMSIPTLALIRNGETVATSVGVIAKPDIIKFISQ